MSHCSQSKPKPQQVSLYSAPPYSWIVCCSVLAFSASLANHTIKCHLLQTTNRKQHTKVIANLFPISKPNQQNLDGIFSSKAKNPKQTDIQTNLCQTEQYLVLIVIMEANFFWDQGNLQSKQMK